MPDSLVVAILGMVEGLTEFLPVSSTGHLLLAEQALGVHKSDLFNVFIQSGAVLAVGVVFAERLRELWRDRRLATTRAYVGQLAAAFALTGAGGLTIKRAGLQLPETPLPIAWATLVGGVLFIACEWMLGRRRRRNAATLTWKLALGIGAMQLVAAIFPGTSRSGATILLALAAGVPRAQAAEFSFLLGIPTLLSAGGLKVAQAAMAGDLSQELGGLAVGSLSAAVFAFATVKWLLGFVRSHSFAVFGWYRVILGGALFLWAS